MEIDTDPLEGSSYDMGVTVKAEIKEEDEDENYNTMVLTGASDQVAGPLRVACERHGDRNQAEKQNKMAPFSSCEDEMLIELINRNPPIYDARLQSYKDNIVRDNIWEEIGKALKKTSNECKKRWKYIRDSYSRCKRKNKLPSGSSASSKMTKWLLFDKLRFLDQIPTERKSIATVQDNYIKEENSEEICTGTGKTERRMCREESSGEETSNEGPSKGGTGKAAPGGETRNIEKTSGVGTSNEIAIGEEIGEAGKTELKITREETSGDKKSNEGPIGAGMCKARTNRVQKRRKRLPKNDFQTGLLQYLKERDQQRQERIRTLTVQESDADTDGINSFCSYVGSILRKLTPSLRVDAKTEVFNLLTGYELKILDQLESKSSFSPQSDSNVTYISKLSSNSPGTVVSRSVAESSDISALSLTHLAPDESNYEGYEESTEYDNNYFL